MVIVKITGILLSGKKQRRRDLEFLKSLSDIGKDFSIGLRINLTTKNIRDYTYQFSLT